MEQDITALHSAVTRIVRSLKIAETKLQVAHRELSFVPADIQTLRYLSNHAGSKLSQLAQHLGVVPTTASSVIDRLVERGYVARARPENNRRAISLALTEDGQTVYARLETEERVTMRVMLEALPEADRAAFVRSMSTIAEAVAAE